MKEKLLIFLALILFSTLSWGQQQASTQAKAKRIQQEFLESADFDLNDLFQLERSVVIKQLIFVGHSLSARKARLTVRVNGRVLDRPSLIPTEEDSKLYFSLEEQEIDSLSLEIKGNLFIERIALQVVEQELRPPLFEEELFQLEKLLANNSWRVRFDAAKELSFFPVPKALELAFKAMQDSDSDVRRAAETSLDVIEQNLKVRFFVPELTQILEVQLNASSWRMRFEAAKLIGQMNLLNSYFTLLAHASDRDSDVRQAISKSLEQLELNFDFTLVLNEQRDLFFQELLQNNNWAMRQKMARLLAKSPSFETFLVLIQASTDRDSDVRNTVALSLDSVEEVLVQQRLQFSEIEKLAEIMETHSSWSIRRRLALLFGKLEQSSVIIPLLNTMSDRDSDVRAAAQQSLNSIKQSNLMLSLRGKDIEDIGDVLLHDSSWSVRQMSARLLGETHSSLARTFLLEGMNDRDSDVRSACRQALSRI